MFPFTMPLFSKLTTLKSLQPQSSRIESHRNRLSSTFTRILSSIVACTKMSYKACGCTSFLEYISLNTGPSADMIGIISFSACKHIPPATCSVEFAEAYGHLPQVIAFAACAATFRHISCVLLQYAAKVRSVNRLHGMSFAIVSTPWCSRQRLCRRWRCRHQTNL